MRSEGTLDTDMQRYLVNLILIVELDGLAALVWHLSRYEQPRVTKPVREIVYWQRISALYATCPSMMLGICLSSSPKVQLRLWRAVALYLHDRLSRPFRMISCLERGCHSGCIKLALLL